MNGQRLVHTDSNEGIDEYAGSHDAARRALLGALGAAALLGSAPMPLARAAGGATGASRPIDAGTARPLPRERRVAGGVAWIDLGPAAGAPANVTRAERRVLVRVEDARAWAVVGIPLEAPVGPDSVVVGRGGTTRTLEYHVGPYEYVTQRLKVEPRHVELAPADLARATRERAHLLAVLSTWSEPGPVTLALRQPVPGRRSSSFGMRRVFNDQPRNPHNGLDIAAPTGTPVVAPAAGRVVDIGDYFFNGGTVILDHGHGFLTLYCHLSRMDAKPGDVLDTGATLGAVGSTGRSTGPHLHWGVMLNRAWVDPGLFMAT